MVTSKQYQRSTRGRLPDWFLRRPPEHRTDDIYLKAHARLSTHRLPFPEQIGPLPWKVVDDYGRRYGFGTLMHEFFVDVIMLLDQLYRNHFAEEREKQAKKQRREEFKANAKQRHGSGIEARRTHRARIGEIW